LPTSLLDKPYMGNSDHLKLVNVIKCILLIFTLCPSLTYAWDSENKVSIGFSSGFGIDAKFNSPATPFAAPQVEQLRIYDDGHVDTTSTSGDSWNASWMGGNPRNVQGVTDWSYLNASQFETTSSTPGTLAFNYLRPNTQTTRTLTGDSERVPGYHIRFRREGRASGNVSFGFQAALDYQKIEKNNLSSILTDVTLSTDYYSVQDPTTFPAAPYTGTPSGAQISGSAINSALSTTSGEVVYENLFEAEMFILSLGMDLQVEISERNNLLFGMGVFYAPFKYEYLFNESYRASAGDPLVQWSQGSRKDNDSLFGAYFLLGWEFALNDYTRAYINARHMHTDAWQMEYSEDRSMYLQFRESLFVDSGISFHW